MPFDHYLISLAAVEGGLFAHFFLRRFVRELRVDPDTRHSELTDYFRRRVVFAPEDILRLSLHRDHATFRLRSPPEQFILVVESREAIKNDLLFAEFLAAHVSQQQYKE